MHDQINRIEQNMMAQLAEINEQQSANIAQVLTVADNNVNEASTFKDSISKTLEAESEMNKNINQVSTVFVSFAVNWDCFVWFEELKTRPTDIPSGPGDLPIRKLTITSQICCKKKVPINL